MKISQNKFLFLKKFAQFNDRYEVFTVKFMNFFVKKIVQHSIIAQLSCLHKPNKKSFAKNNLKNKIQIKIDKKKSLDGEIATSSINISLFKVNKVITPQNVPTHNKCVNSTQYFTLLRNHYALRFTLE